MKNIFQILFIVFASIQFTSCGVERVYTSASYSHLKSHTEKPIYNGNKEVATYFNGSFNNNIHPQRDEHNDKANAASFSLYQVRADKFFNYYYGIGGSLGNYIFKSPVSYQDYINFTEVELVKKDEKFNYYNINAKSGITFTKTWKKMHCNILGFELIYTNEFGPYIDKINDLQKEENLDRIIIVDKKSIFAFNFNSEVIYRVNNDNNVGLGLFLGNVLFIDKEKTNNHGGFYYGLIVKYNYKDFTLSFVTERASAQIESNSFGITYRIFNKSKSKNKEPTETDL